MKKARMTLHPSYRIGTISPRLFGAFLEPIGSMVDGSMYNPRHPTADGQGMRGDLSRPCGKPGCPPSACLPMPTIPLIPGRGLSAMIRTTGAPGAIRRTAGICSRP